MNDVEYKISTKEISRRKKAYITLCISLLSGSFLSSTIFKLPLSIAVYLSVILALFFSFSFLQKLSKAKIIMTDQLLKRVVNTTSEGYQLSKINRVKVKWTTNKTIREIYIWLNNGQSIFISALEHPNKFKKDFLKRLEKDVIIKDVYEPLDFDHPLFYSLLGFPISGVGVLAIKSISGLDYQHTKTIMLAFAVYFF